MFQCYMGVPTHVNMKFIGHCSIKGFMRYDINEDGIKMTFPKFC